MDHGALDDALEAGGRLGILVIAGDQIVEFGVDIVEHGALQLLEVDVAGAHDGGRVGVVDQRQQQMLERGIFVMPLVGESRAPDGAPFRGLGRNAGIQNLTSSPSRIAADAGADGQNP